MWSTSSPPESNGTKLQGISISLHGNKLKKLERVSLRKFQELSWTQVYGVFKFAESFYSSGIHSKKNSFNLRNYSEIYLYKNLSLIQHHPITAKQLQVLFS